MIQHQILITKSQGNVQKLDGKIDEQNLGVKAFKNL